jgi:hypothetical protein
MTSKLFILYGLFLMCVCMHTPPMIVHSILEAKVKNLCADNEVVILSMLLCLPVYTRIHYVCTMYHVCKKPMTTQLFLA